MRLSVRMGSGVGVGVGVCFRHLIPDEIVLPVVAEDQRDDHDNGGDAGECSDWHDVDEDHDDHHRQEDQHHVGEGGCDQMRDLLGHAGAHLRSATTRTEGRLRRGKEEGTRIGKG